jgi:hypothetical protein
MNRNTTITAIGAACLMLGACTTGNERSDLGNGREFNTLRVAEFDGHGEPPPPGSDGPSVTSLSRANWKTTTVVVPVDGLAAKPTYAKSNIWATKSARARGQMPNATTALEVNQEDTWTQVGEAAGSPVFAMWDFARSVCWDGWCTPPWHEAVLPTQVYVRAAPETPRTPPTDSAAGASH